VHCEVWIDAGNVDQFVRVENAEPPVVKLYDPFGPQVAQDAVDMNKRLPGRVADVLLGQR
jgi:hypothetical protein